MTNSLPANKILGDFGRLVMRGQGAEEFVASNPELLQPEVATLFDGLALESKVDDQDLSSLYSWCADFLRRQCLAYSRDTKLVAKKSEIDRPETASERNGAELTSEMQLDCDALLEALLVCGNEDEMLTAFGKHLPALVSDTIDAQLLELVASIREGTCDSRKEGELYDEEVAQRLLAARDLCQLVRSKGFVQADAYVSTTKRIRASELFFLLAAPVSGDARYALISQNATVLSSPEFAQYVNNFTEVMRGQGEALESARTIQSLLAVLTKEGLSGVLNAEHLRTWLSTEGMSAEDARKLLLMRAVRRVRMAESEEELREVLYGQRATLLCDDMHRHYDEVHARVGVEDRQRAAIYQIHVEREFLHRIREIGIEATLTREMKLAARRLRD